MATKARTPKSTETATIVAAAAAPAASATGSPAPSSKAQGPALVAVGGKAPRTGTASAVCYDVLVANIGQPREVVLAALKAAETAWHAEHGRAVKGVAPAGWLRTHSATFA